MRSVEKLYDVTEPFNLFCLLIDSKSLDFDETFKDKRWRQAMEEEIEATEKNNTWELSTLPKGYQVIGVKWLFKIDENVKGNMEKYKARLVAKCYKQKHGVEYEEMFAPVAIYIRIDASI